MGDNKETKMSLRNNTTTPLKNGDSNIQYGTVAKDNDKAPLMFVRQDSKLEQFKRFACTLTMEPVIFCFLFGFVMNMAMMTNIMMDKGCLYHLQYPEEMCKNRTAYPDVKKEVEVLAANYSLYANLLSFIAAFFMNFITPWSDRYGRKLPLIVAIFGAILSDVGYILCIVYFDSRLEYLILARLPAELCGGFICVLTIIYSHTSEVTKPKNRTLKYTFIEIAFGFGIGLGALSGGMMYKYSNYLTIYATVASLHAFCLLWVWIVVEETRGMDCPLTWREKAKDFFVCEHFVTAIKTSFKRREHGIRALMLLMLASVCIVVLTYESLSSIGYLYVYHIYSWDPTKYSVVMTVAMLGQMPVMIVAVPIFIRVCKLTDYQLGLIGVLSIFIKNALFSIAKLSEYIYYAGFLFGFLANLSTLAVRTGISKLIHKDELGSVFSFLATCEAVVPILGTICITKVYEATMDMFPSVTYGMVAFLLLLPLGTFIWAVVSSKEKYNVATEIENNGTNSKA